MTDAGYTEGMADPPERQDVVILAGPTEDGQGIRVLRARDEHIEGGEVRPLKEGRPLGSGEVVKLTPRKGAARVCDVEVVANLGSEERGGGPPKVATKAYRESWDRIFGGADERNRLN
jgi:hypothetical protein